VGLAKEILVGKQVGHSQGGIRRLSPKCDRTARSGNTPIRQAKKVEWQILMRMKKLAKRD
jgi:hypothetical protein